MSPAESDDRHEVGQATMRNLFGVGFDIEPRPGEPANSAELNRLMVEHAFTDSWARPTLDAPTRSLVTIAMMIALGQEDELKAHVAGALALGISKDEIVELLIHVLAYCGTPRTAAAWKIVRSVFARTTSS